MDFHPEASPKAPAAAKKARRTLGVSAVVVTFWTGDILFECLDSLLSHRKITEIIVINNGNPQTTIKRLHEMTETNQRLNGKGLVALEPKTERSRRSAILPPDAAALLGGLNIKQKGRTRGGRRRLD